MLNMQNYELLIERIAKSSGVEKAEIEKRVEAKRAKLSGLISKEGAAQIIAAELNVGFDDQDFKISELMSGMKKANVVGKIISIFPVREFDKNGRKGKVVNFFIADETGSVRVVLWDTNHIELIEKGEIKQNDVVDIKNAGVRNMELHLSGFSEIKKSDKKIDNVKTEKVVLEKTIEEIQQGMGVKLRGIVVQMFAPRFFSVCSECGKKVNQEAEGFACAEHGRVLPKERAILNFVIDDGTETTRAVLFSEAIEKLISEEDLKNEEKLAIFREDLLGRELWVSGNVKTNQLFNNLEINVSDIERVDVEKLIGKMEKNN